MFENHETARAFQWMEDKGYLSSRPAIHIIEFVCNTRRTYETDCARRGFPITHDVVKRVMWGEIARELELMWR